MAAYPQFSSLTNTEMAYLKVRNLNHMSVEIQKKRHIMNFS